MEYLKAKKEDLGQIYQLVQDTIQTVYPQYYPHEIVAFFSCQLLMFFPLFHTLKKSRWRLIIHYVKQSYILYVRKNRSHKVKRPV